MALRWDDTQYMPPHEAEFENGILTVIIIQTKTTGVGKKIEKLKAWVSAEAWLAERYWLISGWRIFSDMNWGRRDFWLPAASRDLEGFQDRPQEYGEAASAGRALLADAKVVVYDHNIDPPLAKTMEQMEADGLKYPLLLSGMNGFWSLHGDRATLNSWASCLHFDKETRQMIGRWSPSGSDEYVRTARRVVLHAQVEISRHIRSGCTPQSLGEDELYEDMVKHMRDRGALPANIILQRKQLEMAFLSTSVYNNPGSRWILGNIGPPGDDGHAGQFPVALENGLPQIEDGAGVLPCTGSVSDTEEISQIAYPEGTWIVSQNISGKARTLHRVGAGVCWRVPGIHYKYFETLSEDVSDLSEVEIMRLFDQPCKDCFPKLKGGASGSASQESSSSGDESSVA
jgi:hypothetical protein